MHFVSAGGLALSVGEIMLKSDTALYHFCTINIILKKYLRLSFDSPSYFKGIITIRKMHGREGFKIFGGPVCTVTTHTWCSQYYSVSLYPISHTTSTCQVQVK